MLMRQCPRCRHRSEGVSYLRKPSRLALLIGASVVTYGIGGLVVHGLCRGRRYCANCGVRWRTPAMDMGSLDVFSDDADKTPEQVAALAKLRRRGERSIRRLRGSLHILRLAGSAGALYGVVRATDAILNGNLYVVAHGLFLANMAAAMFVLSCKALESFRPSVSREHARKVLMLADRRGGVLTVTDVATDLGLGLVGAEELMAHMDDGFRVRSEAGADGAVRYEFPEILHRERLGRP